MKEKVITMSITIDLSQQELVEIRELTKAADDAAGVVSAAREFVRWTRLRELKAASGKVDFDESWQQLESNEVQESSHGANTKL